jgi:hypothetical protein
MSNTRIDSSTASVNVATSRKNEGPSANAGPSPFRAVLASGTNALLTGAEVATGVLGGPVLAAAVREAKTDVVSGIAGTPGGAGGGAAGAAAAALGAPGSEMSAMHAMQKESQVFNLQMLALQEKVGQENRTFTTISAVAKAKDDTARSLINKIG